MAEIWILIFVVFTHGGDVRTSSIEFNSKESCIAAVHQFVVLQVNHERRVNEQLAKLSWVNCFKK